MQLIGSFGSTAIASHSISICIRNSLCVSFLSPASNFHCFSDSLFGWICRRQIANYWQTARTSHKRPGSYYLHFFTRNGRRRNAINSHGMNSMDDGEESEGHRKQRNETEYVTSALAHCEWNGPRCSPYGCMQEYATRTGAQERNTEKGTTFVRRNCRWNRHCDKNEPSFVRWRFQLTLTAASIHSRQ